MSDVEKDETSTDPTTPEARLVDIVVEEVSLVDQAANKRQFLVIKRARSGMSMTSTTKENQTETANDDAATLEAIERVGKAVAELADEVDEPSEVARLVAIAEQLGELVRSILDADAEEAAESPAEEQAEAEGDAATKAAPTPSGAASSGVAAPAPSTSKDAAFAKIEETLASLRAKANVPSAPAAAEAPPAPPAPPPPPAAPSADPLTKVLAAIETIGTDLRAQAQRLGRLEKGVGLPSSQPTSERSRSEPADVSWPLDLNAPVGRDVVDKRVSFHDD